MNLNEQNLNITLYTFKVQLIYFKGIPKSISKTRFVVEHFIPHNLPKTSHKQGK